MPGRPPRAGSSIINGKLHDHVITEGAQGIYPLIEPTTHVMQYGQCQNHIEMVSLRQSYYVLQGQFAIHEGYSIRLVFCQKTSTHFAMAEVESNDKALDEILR